jgi:hypothetical protein
MHFPSTEDGRGARAYTGLDSEHVPQFEAENKQTADVRDRLAFVLQRIPY